MDTPTKVQQALLQNKIQELDLKGLGFISQLPPADEIAALALVLQKDLPARRTRILSEIEVRRAVHLAYKALEKNPPPVFMVTANSRHHVPGAYAYKAEADVMDIHLLRVNQLFCVQLHVYRGEARTRAYGKGPVTIVRAVQPHHKQGLIVPDI